MALGFVLVVLLVLGAAWIGYHGSISIQDNAQTLARRASPAQDPALELETRIADDSADLLRTLEVILGACFVLAVAVSALTLWFTRRTLLRLEQQTEELHRVSWQMIEDQERVARRFSHELHDELGQSLTALKGMAKRLTSAEFEEHRQELVGLLDESLSGVRELSQLLRPVILDDLGLVAGIRWQTEKFSQRTRIEVDCSCSVEKRLADQLETHLFRITQEALTNIARHSGATRAWVRLASDSGRVSLTIEDNGRGMQARNGSTAGFGLTGMGARARQLNGEFTVENRDGGGVRIHVEVPMKEAEENAEQKDPRTSG